MTDLVSHGAQAVQAKDSAYKAAVDTKDAVSQKMSEAAGAASDAKDSAGQKASETYDAAADKAGQVRFAMHVQRLRGIRCTCIVCSPN